MSLFKPYDPVSWYVARNFRVTSRYGPRTHPVTKVPQSFHYGVDFGPPRNMPPNAPIGSPYNSTVWRTGNYGGRGLTVVAKIDGTNEMMLFQHLARIDVRPGQKLRIGDSVGLCGTTGQSTGIHLHFEIRIYDGRTDLGPKVWGDPAQYNNSNYTVRDLWEKTIEERRQRIMELFKR